MSQLRLVAKQPRFIVSKLNNLGHLINSEYHKRYVGKSGVNLMEQDWDNLLILDACRFDEYSRHHRFKGTPERIESLASMSEEWYQENIGDSRFYDTVCVTANPYTESYKDRFHDCKILYSAKYWDEDLCTVPPAVVGREASEMSDAYPRKRLLVHFMQPHFPPIGPSRENLPRSGNPPDGTDTDRSHIGLQTHLRGRVAGVTEEKALVAYRENLEIVLGVLEDLIPNLPGKTVVSADHGELFGERLYPIPVRGILHPRHVRIEPLIAVPWHVIKNADRRSIRAEPPVDRSEETDPEVIESRLRDLGYR